MFQREDRAECSLTASRRGGRGGAHTLVVGPTSSPPRGSNISSSHRRWNKSPMDTSHENKWGRTNGYAVICPRHFGAAVNSTFARTSLCPSSDIWCWFSSQRVVGREGGVVRLGGTLPSLQSSPAGTGTNLRQRPAERLCLNSVALYYPT